MHKNADQTGLIAFNNLLEVLGQQEKQDFLIPLNETMFAEDEMLEKMTLGFSGNNGDYYNFPLTDNGHSCLASITEMGKKYYDKCLTHGRSLLVQNVNHWLDDISDRKMIRVLDGEVRGILSDKYRRMDNLPIAQACMMVFLGLQKTGNLSIKDCGLTQKFMRIKATFPQVRAEVAGVGDIVEAGIMVQNSEIGFSSTKVFGYIHVLRCSNGQISMYGIRKYHIGEVYQDFTDVLLTADTVRMTDLAVLNQLKDVIVDLSTNPNWFLMEVDKMNEAVADVSRVGALELPERFGKAWKLTDDETKIMVADLMRASNNDLDAPVSRYAVSNSLTWAAQFVGSYDRRIELETLGGQLMAEPQKLQWATLK